MSQAIFAKKHVVTVVVDGHAAKKPPAGTALKAFAKGPFNVNPGVMGSFTITVRDESGKQLFKGTGNDIRRP